MKRAPQVPQLAQRRGTVIGWLVGLVLAAGSMEAQTSVSAFSTTRSTDTLTSGTWVRIMVSNRPVPPLHTAQRVIPPQTRGTVELKSFEGVLAAISADSLAVTEAGTHRHVSVARAYVVRLDTAAGHKSRFKRALLGAPIGMAVGGLLGAPGGNYTAAAFMVLGLPAGVITGAISGGQRWKRVQLPRVDGNSDPR